MKNTTAIHLLLADNNLSYLEIVHKMLRFDNDAYEVDIAASGDECLEKLLDKHYQLVLLDYNIDGGKGLKILSQINKIGLDVPVILLIGEGNEEFAYESIERGAADFIIKLRGHLTTLPGTVSRILNEHRKNGGSNTKQAALSLNRSELLISEANIKQNIVKNYVPNRKIKAVSENYNDSMKLKSPGSFPAVSTNGHFDQSKMIHEISELIHFSYEGSLNHLLEKITQLVCTLFKFKRVTLALLDRRRKTYVKQIMVGYTNGSANTKKILEVPQEAVNKVFADQFKVRVIYNDQNYKKSECLLSIVEERRLQRRNPENIWHSKNVIILNLTDHKGKTFGYISIDEPEKPVVPSHEIFHNMEIFTKLTSLAIENFYRYATIEKRNRRLKKLLITGNIFKLNSAMPEIMKEIAWSIKFSMDFNIVLLGLINSDSGRFEVKAAASDNQNKTNQLEEFSIPIEEIHTVLQKKYSIGKSFLVSKPEPALHRLKDIYYNTKADFDNDRYWQWWKLLIIPIYKEPKKVFGFIIVDAPADGLMPTRETIYTLEILANQLSIAIKNRAAYLQLNNKIEKKQRQPIEVKNNNPEDELQNMVEIFLK